MDLLLNRHYVEVEQHSKLPGEFYQIFERMPYKYTTGDHPTAAEDEFTAAVTHGASSGEIEIENIKPDSDEISWNIPSFADGNDYEMRLVSGQTSYGTKRVPSQARLNNEDSPYFAPEPKWGFFLGPEDTIFVNAYNNTGASNTPEIRFTGMRYWVKEVKDKDTIDKLKNGSLRSSKIIFGAWNKKSN